MTKVIETSITAMNAGYAAEGCRKTSSIATNVERAFLQTFNRTTNVSADQWTQIVQSVVNTCSPPQSLCVLCNAGIAFIQHVMCDMSSTTTPVPYAENLLPT
mmetsp:Transcript_4072/g.9577  ORF Transcript_4072/g.9577 Transcript_4072/m.9577 type:complete len:102 (+) Transcript_4072:527-832(+)